MWDAFAPDGRPSRGALERAAGQAAGPLGALPSCEGYQAGTTSTPVQDPQGGFWVQVTALLDSTRGIYSFIQAEDYGGGAQLVDVPGGVQGSQLSEVNHSTSIPIGHFVRAWPSTTPGWYECEWHDDGQLIVEIVNITLDINGNCIYVVLPVQRSGGVWVPTGAPSFQAQDANFNCDVTIGSVINITNIVIDTITQQITYVFYWCCISPGPGGGTGTGTGGGGGGGPGPGITNVPCCPGVTVPQQLCVTFTGDLSGSITINSVIANTPTWTGNGVLCGGATTNLTLTCDSATSPPTWILQMNGTGKGCFAVPNLNSAVQASCNPFSLIFSLHGPPAGAGTCCDNKNFTATVAPCTGGGGGGGGGCNSFTQANCCPGACWPSTLHLAVSGCISGNYTLNINSAGNAWTAAAGGGATWRFGCDNTGPAGAMCLQYVYGDNLGVQSCATSVTCPPNCSCSGTFSPGVGSPCGEAPLTWVVSC